MSEEKRNSLIQRWSLVSTLAIAVGWLLAYFVFDWKPSAEILFRKDTKLILPFKNSPLISFLSYISIGPIYATMLIHLLYKIKRRPNADGFILTVISGIFVGLTIGLVYGAGYVLNLGMEILYFMVYGAMFGFFLMCFMSGMANIGVGILSVMGSGWSYTFIVSLLAGPTAGFLVFLSFSATTILAFGIIAGLKYFFTKNNFGVAVKEWFLAKNK